jgi:hypothetical protein
MVEDEFELECPHCSFTMIKRHPVYEFAQATRRKSESDSSKKWSTSPGVQ